MTKDEYEKMKQEALERRSSKFTSSKGTFTMKPPEKSKEKENKS